jgi:hypothetical protein
MKSRGIRVKKDNLLNRENSKKEKLKWQERW